MKFALFALFFTIFSAQAEAALTGEQCAYVKERCSIACSWQYPYNWQIAQRAWCRYQSCSNICK